MMWASRKHQELPPFLLSSFRVSSSHASVSETFFRLESLGIRSIVCAFSNRSTASQWPQPARRRGNLEGRLCSQLLKMTRSMVSSTAGYCGHPRRFAAATAPPAPETPGSCTWRDTQERWGHQSKGVVPAEVGRATAKRCPGKLRSWTKGTGPVSVSKSPNRRPGARCVREQKRPAVRPAFLFLLGKGNLRIQPS